MTRLARRLRTDLPIGIRVGLSFSAVYIAMAITAYLLTLISRDPDAIKRDFGLNLPTILLLYAAGGLVGGVIVAVLRPLRSTAFGSFVIGTISTYPLAIAFEMLGMPRVDLYPEGVFVALGLSLIFGGGIGAVMHGRTNGWTT